MARWEREQAPDRTVMFLAPDTGHRYLDAAFAPHAEVPPIDGLAPSTVTDLAELALPWAVADQRVLTTTPPAQRSAPPARLGDTSVGGAPVGDVPFDDTAAGRTR